MNNTLLTELSQLNLLSPLITLVTTYVGTEAVDAFLLHRDFKPKDIKKISLPPELKVEYDNKDINIKINTEFEKSLDTFATKMINTFEKEDLTLFYHNMNALKISKRDFTIKNFILNTNIRGAYDVKTNKITVNEIYSNTSIYHELLHMSSSIYKTKIRYSGFAQTSFKLGNISLGTGINEGYTELLTRRYFTKDCNVSATYRYETTIAEKLEEIIGQERMESLYLNANLQGLIQELKQWNSDKEISKFISRTDFIINHSNDKKYKLFVEKKIQSSLKEINLFLINTYFKKNVEEYKRGFITYEQFMGSTTKYISSLPFILSIKNKHYKTISYEEISNLLATLKSTNLEIEKKHHL